VKYLGWKMKTPTLVEQILNHVMKDDKIKVDKDGIAEFHDESGPAFVLDGWAIWYLDNVRVTFEEWCERTGKTDEEIIFLKLKYNTKWNM
jgi:hypothetical protein